MNWHRTPELLDRLAGEYALGTLHGAARRRFEAVMQAHPEVARAAARWSARLAPLDAPLPELPAGDALWSRIEDRVFGRPAAAPRRWWQGLFGPAPAGALALGLALGLGLPALGPLLEAERTQAQLPESYVGVLATADGRQGLIVASLRRGRTLDLKPIRRTEVPAGATLVLWTLDAQGRASAVAALPPLTRSFTSITLDRPSEEMFAQTVELAVSVEAAGAPPAAPTLPFVYRGLCGKLWPPPAAR